jgi:hypothetical protein
MLFKEIIAVFSVKNATKYINMLCEKYSEIFYTKVNGTYVCTTLL